MSIFPVLCNYVALPSSHIRSPGLLLKETDRQVQCEPRQHQVKRLLENFNNMVEEDSSRTAQDSARSRASYYYFPEPSMEDSLLNPELVNLIKVIKNKSSNDEINSLVNRAKQILALYEIELVVDVTEDQYDMLFSVLRALVREICLFSEGLFAKIQLKRLVICNKQNFGMLQAKYSAKNTKYLAIDEQSFDTQVNVYKEIYKTILSQIIVSRPELVKAFGKLLYDTKDILATDAQKAFEISFLALMQGNNYVTLRDKIEKVKDLLFEHFPKEFSQEWFQNRRKEKKKFCRVRFDFSSTSTLE